VDLVLSPVEVRERWGVESVQAATFQVDAGAHWSVSAVDLVGVETLEANLRRDLSQALLDQTDLSSAGATRRRTVAALRQVFSSHGYPSPTVTSVVLRDPEPLRQGRTATLVFHVESGPPATFGRLRLTEADRRDLSRLEARLEVPFSAGDPWDGQRVATLERNLQRLPSLAHAALTPGPVQPDGTTDVQATLKEAAAAGWKPRIRVASETSLFSAELGAVWTDPSLGDGLSSASVFAQGGYRLLPTLAGPDAFWGNRGAVGGAGATLERFTGPGAGLSLFVSTTARHDAWRGFRATNAGLEAGLRVHPGPHWSVSLGAEGARWWTQPHPAHEALYTPVFGGPVPASSSIPLFRPAAWLTGLRLAVSQDSTDDPVTPTRGTRVEASLLPRGWADADGWTRAELKAAVFVPLAPRIVVAARTQLGATRWDDAAVQQVLPTRFYGGGVGSVRAWPKRGLNPPGWAGGPNDVRIGGNAVGVASLETRYRFLPGLDALALVDSGRVWERVLPGPAGPDGQPAPGVTLDSIQHAAGGGVQLPTPLGTLVVVYAHRLRKETQQSPWVTPGRLHLSVAGGF
jgi:translocation and assembly module TamA